MRPPALFATVAAAILITGLAAAAGWSLAGPALRAAATGNAGLIALVPLVAVAALLLARRRGGTPF